MGWSTFGIWLGSWFLDVKALSLSVVTHNLNTGQIKTDHVFLMLTFIRGNINLHESLPFFGKTQLQALSVRLGPALLGGPLQLNTNGLTTLFCRFDLGEL